MTMRTRNIKINVRLNRIEYDHLKKQAKKSGLSMEALVRNLIMGLDVKPVPPDTLGELRYQVQAIGNNINQIARIANGNGSIDQETIASITAMQREIWQRVKAI